MIDPTFNNTITVYNKHTDKSSGKTITTWKRTVLKECFFKAETATQLNGENLSMANSFICRIPENINFTEQYNGEEDKFTLRPDDIIVKGEVADEIKDVQGQRAENLLQKYKGFCFTVKAVSINTNMPYARHYRASGV